MDDESVLATLLERLRHVNSLEEWSEAADGLREVRSESGFSIWEDRNGCIWSVFGVPGEVERVQVDLATEPLSEQLSPHGSDQVLMRWIDKFFATQERVGELLQAPASYVGYFEDPDFPDERGALYLAQWRRDPAPQIMLSNSGHEPFDHSKKRSRLSLTLACGPLSTEMLRLYRQYLLWPKEPPKSSSY